MDVSRTRSAFNEPIIGEARALDPSNPHQLPTKGDVLLALQMKRRNFMQQNERRQLPPAKDFLSSLTEEIEEIWICRCKAEDRTWIHEVEFIHDQRNRSEIIVRLDLVDPAESIRRRTYFEKRNSRHARL